VSAPTGVSGAGTRPSVRTATAPTRRSSIWCSSVRPMITPGGTTGQETSDPRRLWSYLERIGVVTPPTGNERERERAHRRQLMCLVCRRRLNHCHQLAKHWRSVVSFDALIRRLNDWRCGVRRRSLTASHRSLCVAQHHTLRFLAHITGQCSSATLSKCHSSSRHFVGFIRNRKLFSVFEATRIFAVALRTYGAGGSVVKLPSHRWGISNQRWGAEIPRDPPSLTTEVDY